MPLGGDGREEAEVNDSPVGCQSRLTEAASSRKKEPYRPHQAKPELVTRLEVTSNGVIFFMPLGGDGREEAEVNDSPVGCQSRLTEAASSRKKEPYRPHQAKPELVARLEVTSNGVIFLCIRNFAQIPITSARCASVCIPSVMAAPCRRGVHAFYAVKKKKSEPIPNRDDVRISWVWWSIGDSNS